MYLEEIHLFRTHNKAPLPLFFYQQINSEIYVQLKTLSAYRSGVATHMKSVEIDFEKYDKILACDIYPLSQFTNFVAIHFPYGNTFKKVDVFSIKLLFISYLNV